MMASSPSKATGMATVRRSSFWNLRSSIVEALSRARYSITTMIPQRYVVAGWAERF
jgi:hypothetical protein